MIEDRRQVKLDDQLPQFTFEELAIATNNFYCVNMLGKGGFGAVYKAWKLWNEEDILSPIDPEISNPDYRNDILRCIHIRLLCVQEVARERPTVATVVSMLNSEIADLPLPSHPAFIERQIVGCAESSQQGHET